jgi:alpha-1,2-mannosyltransferase
VVYTGDVDATKEQIISKVEVSVWFFYPRRDQSQRFRQSRFDIKLSSESLHFVFLNSRYLVEDATWPMFTILGQSLGSMYLAWEAVSKFVPDFFIGIYSTPVSFVFRPGVDLLMIDTMGYAFTFHVVSILTGVNIGAYVHYPMVSTEMIRRVESRMTSHNNSASVSSSTLLTRGKLLCVPLVFGIGCL